RRMSFRGGKPSVVGHKNDDCASRQAGSLKGREDASDGAVHLLEHRGIDRMVLDQADLLFGFLPPGIRPRSCFLLFVLLNQVRAGPNWDVNRQKRKIGKERLVRVRLDKANCFIGDSVGGFWVILGIEGWL